MGRTMHFIIWILRLTASIILLQTLFFKFSGSPESVYIFETLGAGDAGRIGSGIMELIVAILLLIPRFTRLGSIGAVGLMAGALASHVFILGIEIQGDGGLLFSLALIITACAMVNFVLTKERSFLIRGISF